MSEKQPTKQQPKTIQKPSFINLHQSIYQAEATLDSTPESSPLTSPSLKSPSLTRPSKPKNLFINIPNDNVKAQGSYSMNDLLNQPSKNSSSSSTAVNIDPLYSHTSLNARSPGPSTTVPFMKSFFGINSAHRRSTSEATDLNSKRTSPISVSPKPFLTTGRSKSSYLSTSQSNLSHMATSSSSNTNASPTSRRSTYHTKQSSLTLGRSVGQVKETSVLVRHIDSNGNKMINRYLVLHELGRGVHGKVKLCIDTETSQQYALKIVNKKSKRKFGGNGGDKIKKEIAIMKKLNHPNVVKLFEVIDDPNQEKIYMELQWKNEYDEPITDLNDVKAYILDIVVGLEYLHYQGIIHRDIKPQNILISSEKKAKIGDFGVSFFSEVNSDDSAELSKTAGSPAFFAPELCLDDFNSVRRMSMDKNGSNELDPQHSSSLESSPVAKSILSEEDKLSFSFSKGKPVIGKAIDVWALGVTLYCLVYGKLPFNANNEFELFAMIPKKPVIYPTDTSRGDLSQSDPYLIDLFNGLFQKEPSQRITLNLVKRHNWLRSAVPGETKEEKESWLNESSPEEYCRKLKEQDPDGLGRYLDASGKILVTDAEIKSAVSVGVVLRRLVEAVKRKLSRGFSWFGTLPTSPGLDSLDRRKSSKSSVKSAQSQKWPFRRSSQQLFQGGPNSGLNGSSNNLSGAVDYFNQPVDVGESLDSVGTSFVPPDANIIIYGDDATESTEFNEMKRDESSMDFHNYLVRPRHDEEEASTEPLSILRLRLAEEPENRRTFSESNLNVTDSGQKYYESPLASEMISEDDAEHEGEARKQETPDSRRRLAVQVSRGKRRDSPSHKVRNE